MLRLILGSLNPIADCPTIPISFIVGDPGADKGGEGKSKRAGKYGTKKSKERRERAPGNNVLPDQFQTVAAVLAPIRSKNGGDSLELVW